MSEFPTCPECGQAIPDRDTQKVIDALPPGAYVIATEYHVADDTVRETSLQVTEKPAVVEGQLIGDLAELHEVTKRLVYLLDHYRPHESGWAMQFAIVLKQVQLLIHRAGL